MLKANINDNGELERQSAVTEFLPQLDLPALVRIAYRQWPIILFGLVSVLLLGIIYAQMAKPRYTSNFLLMIDARKTAMLAAQDPSTGERQIDPGYVESQVEVVKSEGVALQTVRKLNLAADNDFVKVEPSLYSQLSSKVKSYFVTAKPSDPPDPELAALDLVAGGIKAKRVGASYVLDVSYTGNDAAKVYAIANGLADSYLVSELDARIQTTERTNKWLQDRIADVRQKATEADLAVQKYKAENNLVDTSHGSISDQQFADVTTQLTAATAASAEAKARLDRIVEVSKQNFNDATVFDALKSDSINHLRSQYLDLSTRYNDLAQRYGANHQAVLNIRNQMTEIEKAAHDELDRLSQASRSEYEIALSREKSVRKSFEDLKTQNGTTNEAQVTMRNLDSNAQSYRNTLNVLLQRFQETAQEQTFPISGARMITPPSYPSLPSWPKKNVILPAALIFGAILGLAMALLREVFNGGFRTADDVRGYSGIEYLGTLPRIPKRLLRSRIKRGAQDNILGALTPITRQAVIAPFSRFAEAVRNVKVSIDVRRQMGRSVVVAVTSAVPKEGKTSISANLAHLTAQMGHRTILIDLDLHNPSLTRALSPNAKVGIVEVIDNHMNLEHAVRHDAVTGLDFIPAYVPKRLANTARVIGSQSMIDLLETLKQHYEYVYVDLPPVVPVVDARATAALYDCVVFVIEWGKTSREVVREALDSAETLRQRVVGAVLNLADQQELKRLESYRGKAYGSYYANNENN